ncbi:type VII secretion target [Mycobacterium lehmannii]|uniref:type VII secretion target n=1 Tax=Mycobacterium lehmannii TaxID=2048550 RepID=UPI000B93F2B1|nr:type VII secretion target [Mycobacterium lehmannii]
MTDPIHIDPEVMRTVANQHDDIADQIVPAREASAEILAAVNTFGPIMHQFKAAVSDLMVNRDAALLDHEHTHRNAAIGLRREATNFVARDETIAENLRIEHP